MIMAQLELSFSDSRPPAIAEVTETAAITARQGRNRSASVASCGTAIKGVRARNMAQGLSGDR
jgi:hypothetical protein